jgi:hypothetical protein
MQVRGKLTHFQKDKHAHVDLEMPSKQRIKVITSKFPKGRDVSAVIIIVRI